VGLAIRWCDGDRSIHFRRVRYAAAFVLTKAAMFIRLSAMTPDHDLGRCPGPSAPTTLRPSRLERLHHEVKHGLVLDYRVDPPQPLRPELVAIGQQHFEQTAFALTRRTMYAPWMNDHAGAA
jgi:hypothetical protein